MEIAALNPSADLDRAASIRAEKAARDFEAVFVAQMLAPLFSSVETPGLAGGGKGEKAYQSLLQEEIAKAVAARGGFGLADHVKAELLELQSGGKLANDQAKEGTPE